MLAASIQSSDHRGWLFHPTDWTGTTVSPNGLNWNFSNTQNEIEINLYSNILTSDNDIILFALQRFYATAYNVQTPKNIKPLQRPTKRWANYKFSTSKLDGGITWTYTKQNNLCSYCNVLMITVLVKKKIQCTETRCSHGQRNYKVAESFEALASSMNASRPCWRHRRGFVWSAPSGRGASMTWILRCRFTSATSW
jgi:hypothetical protein